MVGSIEYKWGGQQFTVDTTQLDTVGSLKHAIESQTAVSVKRQKIMGLKVKGVKAVTDEALLAELILKPGQKLIVMG